MKRALFILALTLGMFACDDVFEKDLTDKSVRIIAPSNGHTVEPGQVSFLWQEVEGASSYRIRIIGGSSENAGLPVIDTIMYNDSTGIKNTYKRILEEGEYQWSVIANNSAYESKETVFTLHVVGPKPADISGTEIVVTAPLNGSELESGEISFSWKDVPGATYYRFTLVSPEFGNASKVLDEAVITIEDGAISNLHKVTINDIGYYQWKISAGNEMYETEAQILSFSIPEKLPTDISKTTVPIVSPVDGSEAEPGEITFLWKEVAGATSYHLTVVGPAFANSQKVLVDKVFDIPEGSAATTSYAIDIPEGGYEWKIIASNSHYQTIEQIYSLSIVEPGPEDISGRTVQIVAPVNGAEITSGTTTFLWKEVKGATSYHLTVVGPSFANAGTVIVDQIFSASEGINHPTSHTVDIPEGEYEWKIVASNFEYRTKEQIYSLSIVDVEPKPEDISDKTVQIVAPVHGSKINPGSTTFLWKEIKGATSYHLTVVGPSFANARTVLVDQVFSAPENGSHPTSHTVDIPEGEYEWKIVASNSHYQTKDQAYSLSVITTGPKDISGSTVSIISPFDGASLTAGEITFLWSELVGATSYHITIVGPTFQSSAVVIADDVITSRSFKVNIPAGRYQWSIRALNEKYQTVERVFSFEVTEP